MAKKEPKAAGPKATSTKTKSEPPKAAATPAAEKPKTKKPKLELVKGLAEVVGPATSTVVELKNGRRVDFGAVRKAIQVYDAKATIPTDDHEALALLRTLVDARKAEVGEDDVLICGETETDGCREAATADVEFCPFCGDVGPDDTQAGDATPGTEIVQSATEAGLAVQEGELVEALDRLNGYKRDLVGSAYDIGLVLKDIQTRELWKARGSASFKEFVEREAGISRTSAYRYMQLTQEYDRQTFLEIGPKKLELISGIENQEEREAALEDARSGATARQIATPSRSSKSAAPAREAASKSTAPAKSTDITLVCKINGKPVLVPFRNAETGRVIKYHKDGAYAELQISDDVVLRVALKQAKGEEPGTWEGAQISFVRS